MKKTYIISVGAIFAGIVIYVLFYASSVSCYSSAYSPIVDNIYYRDLVFTDSTTPLYPSEWEITKYNYKNEYTIAVIYEISNEQYRLLFNKYFANSPLKRGNTIMKAYTRGLQHTKTWSAFSDKEIYYCTIDEDRTLFLSDKNIVVFKFLGLPKGEMQTGSDEKCGAVTLRNRKDGF